MSGIFTIDAYCRGGHVFIPSDLRSIASVTDPLWGSAPLRSYDRSPMANLDLFVDSSAASAACSSPSSSAAAASAPMWESAGTLDKLRLEVVERAGVPAPFGRGTETVMDETVRKALHITRDRYRIVSVGNGRPTRKNAKVDMATRTDGTEAYISAVRAILRLPPSFAIRLQKIHVYNSGGFFDEHKDTPIAKNHVATIVHVLPTTFAGGDLVLSPPAAAGSGDAATVVTRGGIAIFPTDTPHRVTEVTKGCRVSIQLDVFLADEAATVEEALKTGAVAVWGDYVETLVRTYADDGCFVLELMHEYPLGNALPQEVPEGSVPLKPADRGLYEALLAHPHVASVTFTKVLNEWKVMADWGNRPTYAPHALGFDDEEFSVDLPATLKTRIDLSRSKRRRIGFVMGTDFRTRRPTSRTAQHTGNEGSSLDLMYRSMCLFVTVDSRTSQAKKEERKNAKKEEAGTAEVKEEKETN